jgi:hypothetical protein
MVAVARELPNTGYALEVDGRLKTEFETEEGAWTGAEELKKRFPMLRVKIYDAETKTRGIPAFQAEMQPTSSAVNLCGLIWQPTSDERSKVRVVSKLDVDR